MLLFHYKLMHLPTGAVFERSVECSSRSELLEKINGFNRSALCTRNGTPVWFHWMD